MDVCIGLNWEELLRQKKLFLSLIMKVFVEDGNNIDLEDHIIDVLSLRGEGSWHCLSFRFI